MKRFLDESSFIQDKFAEKKVDNCLLKRGTQVYIIAELKKKIFKTRRSCINQETG